MAVDLADLVPALKLEVNPPGADLFPDATDAEWEGRLANAFWNARLDGMLVGYIESDGLVSPTSGTTDMPRELQQLVVFLAAYDAIMLALRNLRTSFRAQAGPVEYEVQQSAQVLREIATDLRERRNALLGRLVSLGLATDYVIDAVAARQDAMLAGVTHWVGH